MKKALSVILSVLVVISSISCLFTVSSAESSENLFVNGDFANCDVDANTIDDWYLKSGGYVADVVKGNSENLPEGESFNFVTFNKTDAENESAIYNYKTVKLNTNTSYTVSFWIKTKGDALGMKLFLYEPKYISRSGSYIKNEAPQEGQNIYTYTYDNGSSTRVARKEIYHAITDSRNSFTRNGDSSMASFGKVAYPSTEEKWVKITHTFTTGNDEYHVANVRYGISILSSCEAEYISFGGFEFYGTPVGATVVKGLSNNFDLGGIEPYNGALVVDGKASLTATPYGNNKFVGWFNGDKLLSTDKDYTFIYDPTVSYKAVFEPYGNDISDSHESYSSTLAKWVNGSIDNSGSNGAWTIDNTDGSTWQQIKISTIYTRSGNKSAYLGSRYSYAGRIFTGLTKNTDYTLTFYSYMEVATGVSDKDGVMYEFDRKIDRAFITDKSVDVAGEFGAISNSDSRVLAYSQAVYGTGRWEKTTITFNSGDSTDVTLWIYFSAKTITGQNSDGCYVDDISLVCNTVNDDEEESEVMDFENTSNWERYAHGTTNASNGPLATNANTWHKINKNTDAKYILEGDASVMMAPQSQINLIKLKGLKPNTDYLLKFSYMAETMKNSEGTSKSIILSGCGVWNYAAENAKFTFSNSKSNGYLHVSKMTSSSFDTFFAADGTPTSDYYSRRITDQKAGVWYEKTLYFNSGDVYETLSFLAVLEVNRVYFDSFKLVALDEAQEQLDFEVPNISGKIAKGSYDAGTATTTLYENCTEEDYTGYLTTLKNEFFAEYATNSHGVNKFATFVKGNVTVNVEYTPATKVILVTKQMTDTLPLSAESNVYIDKDYKPTIIQIDHNGTSGGGIGMSYVIRLVDGSFIVVDGGHTESSFDNSDRIFNILKAYTPDEKPTIAAWLFTHGHDDHISAATAFIEKYSDEVVVEEFIFNFATLEQYAAVTSSVSGELSFLGVKALLLNIKAFLPNAKISTCHSGYKYHIRNAVIDIMFTLEDIFPQVVGVNFTDINDTCTTYKISFINDEVDQTLLITGDSGAKQCNALTTKYADGELNSDFVQAIHHGISYGSYKLYGLMDPEIVLFPASSNRLMNVLYQPQNRYFIEEDSVKEIALSDYGTRVFELPYKAPEGLLGMNKFTLPSEMDEINTINSYVGVSIRQSGEGGTIAKQALRFKFQIPEHIIRSHTADGYFVSEYGMVVSTLSNYEKTPDVLNYYEGTEASNVTDDGYKRYKAINYNKADGTNVVFDYVNYLNLDDGVSRSVQYTSALYNIGVTENGTDYSKYDTYYVVRPYVVFQNTDGETKVWQGTVNSASVFATMEAILASDKTDEQTLSDKNYVKNFLDGKVADFAKDADAIKAAWVSDAERASLYTPAN